MDIPMSFLTALYTNSLSNPILAVKLDTSRLPSLLDHAQQGQIIQCLLVFLDKEY